MPKYSETEKKLRANVLDDGVKYSKTTVVLSWIGLFVGLWGFFITTVIILYLMTRGYIGITLST